MMPEEWRKHENEEAFKRDLQEYRPQAAIGWLLVCLTASVTALVAVWFLWVR